MMIRLFPALYIACSESEAIFAFIDTTIEFFRDTVLGKLLYYSSGQLYMRHPDEEDPYVISAYIDTKESGPNGVTVDEEKGKDKHLVGFTGDDAENPRNWSLTKKRFVVAALCLYTASIYIGAALWSSSVDDAASTFNVGLTVTQLGTSIFLFGLGIGPMILSPLSEIPMIGATSVYSLSAVIFVLFQLPIVLSDSLAAIMVFRFFTGILASPCLSLGGASIKAMYSARDQGIPMAVWDTATAVGTFTALVIGNYAAQYGGYKWPMWVLLWSASGGLVTVLCFLPETSPDNILYRRARRLRKMTGNTKFLSAAEINYSMTTSANITKDTIIRPIYFNLYLALVYALLFAALESYDTIFVDIYGFTPGQEGITFLGVLIGFLLSLAAYAWFYSSYQQYHFDEHDKILPEKRLLPAFVSAVTTPIGLFWFGWSARKNFHWIMPIIGGSFLGPASAGLFFSILNYLPDAYPSVSSTVLAGNCFMRSTLAGAFPLFITPMYRKLGPGWASTVWALIGCIFAPAPFLFYFYVDRIRRRSDRARKDF